MGTRKPRQTRSKVTVDTIIEAGFIAVATNGTSGTTTRHINVVPLIRPLNSVL